MCKNTWHAVQIITETAVNVPFSSVVTNLYLKYGEPLNPADKILQPLMLLIFFLSHAIASYLVRSYASDDSLYPQDPKQKAIVDQRLYFNAELIFPKLREICVSNNVASCFNPDSSRFLSIFLCDVPLV